MLLPMLISQGGIEGLGAGICSITVGSERVKMVADAGRHYTHV